AAFDRDALLSAAGKAQDLPHRRVEHISEGGAVDVIAGALGCRAQNELLATHHVGPALYAVWAEAVADPEIGRDDADPGELSEIDVDLRRLDDRLSDEARIEDRHHGAVLRCGRVEITHRREAAGAGHVLHDDVRIARDVLADEAGDDARVDVVAAAR